MAGASSTNSGSATTTSIQLDFYGFTNTNLGQVATINIMDYSATDKHKTTLIRNGKQGGSNDGVEAIAGRWANTAAITSLEIFSITGGGITFSAGSTFALYGIAS